MKNSLMGVLLIYLGCGAIHTAVNNEQGKYLDSILNRIRKDIATIPYELIATKINSLCEVDYLKEKFPNYEGTIESMMYDLDTSKVF